MYDARHPVELTGDCRATVKSPCRCLYQPVVPGRCKISGRIAVIYDRSRVDLAGSCDITEQWKQIIVERACHDGLVHFRIARRILGDPASAEDVCQQAYLKALNARDSIKDADKLAGWLSRVIVNESLDALRKRKREHKAYEAHRAAASNQLRIDSPSDQSETREYMTLLLERLDEPIRTVVVMRTMQGMSGNEVKRALGCSAALVSRRLHQGLDQLREWMTEEMAGKEAAR